MSLPNTPLRLAAACLCLILAGPTSAALLSSEAAYADGTQSNVSLGSVLGSPSTNWFVLLDWVQAGPVVIEIPVLDSPGGSSGPTPHSILLSARNTSPDDWNGFSVGVEGPAEISASPLPNLVGLFPAPLGPSDAAGFSFEGLDWPASDPGALFVLPVFINFGIDVSPPESGEPVRLTLSPTPVPEPGTALLVAVGAAFCLARRRHTLSAV